MSQHSYQQLVHSTGHRCYRFVDRNGSGCEGSLLPGLSNHGIPVKERQAPGQQRPREMRKAKKDAARGASGAAERVKLHQAKHDSNRAKQQVDDLQRHMHKSSTDLPRRTIGLPAKS